MVACLVFVGMAVGCGSEKLSPNEGETTGIEQPKPKKTAGIFTSFQTEDIYGDEVDQDIFKDYDVTMVNVWGTYCGPCLREMPDLGKLHKAYSDQGVQIVGILVDAQDPTTLRPMEKQMDLAKEIVETTGADYRHLLLTPELIDGKIGAVYAIPHTFFVDGEGNELGIAYDGSRSKEEWEKIIETVLSDVQEQKKEATAE